jgi:hypothetical protein
MSNPELLTSKLYKARYSLIATFSRKKWGTILASFGEVYAIQNSFLEPVVGGGLEVALIFRC